MMLPDAVPASAITRRRMMGLDGAGHEEKKTFDAPSNVMFIPAEYWAVNCCVGCEPWDWASEWDAGPGYCSSCEPLPPPCLVDCYNIAWPIILWWCDGGHTCCPAGDGFFVFQCPQPSLLACLDLPCCFFATCG